MPSKNRLPHGFVGFRGDLGDTIKRARIYNELRQEDLAKLVGVRRETMSRIERGREWPRPDTVHALQHYLDLTWADFAVKGQDSRLPPRSRDSHRDDHLLDLGRDLRTGRLKLGRSLRDIAGRCGLSAAQLSRIERGEMGYSKVYAERPQYWLVDFKDRRLRWLVSIGRA